MSTTTGAVRSLQRELSPLERWYWIADQISPLNVVGRVRLHGPVPRASLRSALTALQARHPPLRVVIEADTTGRHPRFVPADGRPVPLDHRTLESPEAVRDGWARVIDEELVNGRIDPRTGPLATAVVLSGPGPAGEVHDLILSVPHVIADGTTVISLLRQWAELAAGGGPAGPRAALPPAEDLFPAEHRGTAGQVRAKAKADRDQADLERLRPHRVDADRPVPFEQRRTRFLHRSLDAPALDRLARACRARGVTIHGVLAAAMVRALATEAGAADGSWYSIGSPVDFRGGLEPPVDPDDVGSYVATIPTLVEHLADRPLWDTAEEISADLRRRKALGEQFSMINQIGSSGPQNLAESLPFVRHLDEKGPINFCLSNIGRFPFPDTVGPWRATGAQFVASLSVVGAFVATVNSSHHQLAWNFTYAQGLVRDERAARIADSCVERVLALVRAAD
ncbi:condensation domain-containing protein [Streptomyces griseus]|uniref:Phthiocerol/phthiodiolone dimycocerosyl transferase n=1 Tax=Streptomyces stephensoniae TaxID=3375367 RepID=A0ABU2W907_9ACTN|nr:condensation domain-containing protein [Streptomyces griseus]MDT0494363.1 condensation domain-containing protein [Streptomyces griseus]